MCKSKLLFLVVVFATLANAEIEELDEFGTCAVFNDVDELTDEVRFNFSCISQAPQTSPLNNKPSIAITLSEGNLWVLHLQPNERLIRFEEYVSVAFRIDKGKLYEKQAHFDSKSSYAFLVLNEQEVGEILTDLSHGLKFYMRVDRVRSEVELIGAFEAVNEFTNRVNVSKG